MKSKNFLNYCKYSGIWVNFALNPYHWRINFNKMKPDEMDPGLYAVYFTIGPLSVRAIVDDGSW